MEDLATEQEHLSGFRAEDDQSRRSLDLAGDNNYRLVGMVSHRGGATHSGHYVADVYSVGRGHWYDDRSVSCVQESDVLGDGHQTARNGYIFFYLHFGLCSQVPAAAALGHGRRSSFPSLPRLRQHPSRGIMNKQKCR